MDAEAYNYKLPKELIANSPAEPRDSARLMVYSTKTDEIVFDTFANLARYIPAESVLVLNDTKVVPARLQVMKSTGGAVNILFLMNEWQGGEMIKGLPDRAVNMNEPLTLVNRPLIQAVSHENEEFTFKLLVSPAEFREACTTYGRTPLPPYIHADIPEEKLREEYQSTFAEKPASVAAPTASLHFTDRVFKALELKGIVQAKVTLHVGRGTFSPVTDAMAASGHLHSEPIHVSETSAKVIASAKQSGKMVIASGTTALRTIEAAAAQILAGQAYEGETALFVKPPYGFKVADALITNFHLPGTSLLMLLDAFMQWKGAKKSWHELYEAAIREHMRFYSFGDAMLII